MGMFASEDWGNRDVHFAVNMTAGGPSYPRVSRCLCWEYTVRIVKLFVKDSYVLSIV